MQNDTTTTVHVALDVYKDSIVAAYSVGLREVQTRNSLRQPAHCESTSRS